MSSHPQDSSQESSERRLTCISFRCPQPTRDNNNPSEEVEIVEIKEPNKTIQNSGKSMQKKVKNCLTDHSPSTFLEISTGVTSPLSHGLLQGIFWPQGTSQCGARSLKVFTSPNFRSFMLHLFDPFLVDAGHLRTKMILFFDSKLTCLTSDANSAWSFLIFTAHPQFLDGSELGKTTCHQQTRKGRGLRADPKLVDF